MTEPNRRSRMKWRWPPRRPPRPDRLASAEAEAEAVSPREASALRARRDAWPLLDRSPSLPTSPTISERRSKRRKRRKRRKPKLRRRAKPSERSRAKRFTSKKVAGSTRRSTPSRNKRKNRSSSNNSEPNISNLSGGSDANSRSISLLKKLRLSYSAGKFTKSNRLNPLNNNMLTSAQSSRRSPNDRRDA